MKAEAVYEVVCGDFRMTFNPIERLFSLAAKKSCLIRVVLRMRARVVDFPI